MSREASLHLLGRGLAASCYSLADAVTWVSCDVAVYKLVLRDPTSTGGVPKWLTGRTRMSNCSRYALAFAAQVQILSPSFLFDSFWTWRPKSLCARQPQPPLTRVALDRPVDRAVYVLVRFMSGITTVCICSCGYSRLEKLTR